MVNTTSNHTANKTDQVCVHWQTEINANTFQKLITFFKFRSALECGSFVNFMQNVLAENGEKVNSNKCKQKFQVGVLDN
ncbi:hypothetical protein T10_12512 [Trichinella papuae]|uniref:Uncharacterized protein n=1 Tax=Trichinella papuae TaxID=268474 RepID=A0A0V1M606_9BILA|nr:hypothetical protein T10_12512 [Trichinella papuae]